MTMNRYFALLFLSLITQYSIAQNLSGQWKGNFIDKSSARGSFAGDKCEYVLELDVKGSSVIGTTYTYFTEGGKRFYTICKLEGKYDSKKKLLEIKETERTKTNIPSNINNCFQIHKLTYFKQGDVETLEGNWDPAPNQKGNCGFGVTNLAKKTLVNSYPQAYANISKLNEQKQAESPKSITKPNTTNKPNSKPSSIKPNTNPITQAEVKPEETAKPTDDKANNTIPVDPKLENRKPNVIKTIEVSTRTIKIDLYDNGDVDGDSISVFFNNKLLLSEKRLSEKPISLLLTIEDNDDENELVMFAENLGVIAPNTALMIVTDGPNRYEVRISSDLEKSGVIRFVRKKKP